MEPDVTAAAPGAAPARFADAPAAIGDVLQDRWSVTQIRSGGQAWVLVVDDLGQGDRRAIKVPFTGPLTGDSELVVLFAAEPHPHVVTALDVADVGGRRSLVLEYVPGSLADVIRYECLAAALREPAGTGRPDAPVPAAPAPDSPAAPAPDGAAPAPDGAAPESAAPDTPEPPAWLTPEPDIVQEICAGMAYLSAQGEFAHLDLKPSNVLIDGSGHAKIADFGVSMQVRIRDGHFAAAAGSTWAYAAPEVIRGEPCDSRADIFSFGVLLYELLTGRLPYPFALAPSPAAQRTQLLGYYQSPGPAQRSEELYYADQMTQTQVPVALPDGPITMILSGCLQVHPGSRPSSFHELSGQIARELGIPAVQAEAVPLPEPDRQRRVLAMAQALIRLRRFDEAVRSLNRLLRAPVDPALAAETARAARSALLGAGRPDVAAALERWL